METMASTPGQPTLPPLDANLEQNLDSNGIHFDAQTRDWLAGNSFSAAGRVAIGGSEIALPSRVNYLCDLLTKKVSFMSTAATTCRSSRRRVPMGNGYMDVSPRLPAVA